MEVVKTCKEASLPRVNNGQSGGKCSFRSSRGPGPIQSPTTEGRKLPLKEALVPSPGGGCKKSFHRVLTNK